MTDTTKLSRRAALKGAAALAPTAAASIGYASVYPLVMCLRILAPQLLVLGLM